MNPNQWVLQRLPGGTRFDRNGVYKTVEVAVQDALDDYPDVNDQAQARYALADLLDILASDVLWLRERQGEWSGDGPLLEQRAKQLREEADGIVHGPGSIVSIPAIFECDTKPWDENAK